ncbi:methyl-accepting chemotaxis protein [Gammaproteobacteria bacterium]
MNPLTLIQKFWLMAIMFGITLVGDLSLILWKTRTMAGSAEHFYTTQVPLLDKANALRYAVVQIQQHLQDISATRAQDGLDGGLHHAEEYVATARTLLAELAHLDAADPTYRSLLPALNAYYDIGRRMARAYVDQGPTAGNRLMPEFDIAAEQIENQLKPILDRIQKDTSIALETQADSLDVLTTYLVVGSLLLAGVMAYAIIVLLRSIRPLPAILNDMHRIAAGDLTGAPVVVRCRDEVGKIADALDTMKRGLKELLDRIAEGSREVVSAAEKMAKLTADTRERITGQHREVGQVATSIEEMSTTVRQVSQNADAAAEAANRAQQEASSGRVVVDETAATITGLAREVERAAETITRLGEDSESIGTILDVIRGIADQTNLLALNAAIEAARAGEQGRGFAVVADEVRTLASRTQQSTQEIHSKIERLQAGARNAVEVMRQGRSRAEESVRQAAAAGERLSAITTAVSTISEMNTQIATVAEQQSVVAGEITRRVTRISTLSDQTTTDAETAATAGTRLRTQAEALGTVVAHFHM